MKFLNKVDLNTCELKRMSEKTIRKKDLKGKLEENREIMQEEEQKQEE